MLNMYNEIISNKKTIYILYFSYICTIMYNKRSYKQLFEITIEPTVPSIATYGNVRDWKRLGGEPFGQRHPPGGRVNRKVNSTAANILWLG